MFISLITNDNLFGEDVTSRTILGNDLRLKIAYIVFKAENYGPVSITAAEYSL